MALRSSIRRRWKKQEQRVAEMFGSRRTPLSGSNSAHETSSDTLHGKYYIECKNRKKLLVVRWMQDILDKATKENKVPMLALKSSESKYDYVMLKLEDFKKLTETTDK